MIAVYIRTSLSEDYYDWT